MARRLHGFSRMKDLEIASPEVHVANVLAELEVLIDHVQRVRAIGDPATAVLFDASAEVLTGIKHAFEHYEAARK